MVAYGKCKCGLRPDIITTYMTSPVSRHDTVTRYDNTGSHHTSHMLCNWHINQDTRLLKRTSYWQVWQYSPVWRHTGWHEGAWCIWCVLTWNDFCPVFFHGTETWSRRVSVSVNTASPVCVYCNTVTWLEWLAADTEKDCRHCWETFGFLSVRFGWVEMWIDICVCETKYHWWSLFSIV